MVIDNISNHPRGADWKRFQACLFDLDGVITPTAEVHRRAWAETFAAHDFTEEDYLRSVDGKPRYEGVATFLSSRGITIPYGTPADSPDTDTICGIGNRKNTMFNAVLERDGVVAYPGTVALLDLLDEFDVPVAVVSSSRNAQPVLRAAGLRERFPLVVDGVTADELGLAGKPAPDTFLHAAHKLGVEAAHAVVIEDAEVGVAAGVAGGFASVIGVDRGNNRGPLTEAGAHVVVDDLIELVERG